MRAYAGRRNTQLFLEVCDFLLQRTNFFFRKTCTNFFNRMRLSNIIDIFLSVTCCVLVTPCLLSRWLISFRPVCVSLSNWSFFLGHQQENGMRLKYLGSTWYLTLIRRCSFAICSSKATASRFAHVSINRPIWLITPDSRCPLSRAYIVHNSRLFPSRRPENESIVNQLSITISIGASLSTTLDYTSYTPEVDCSGVEWVTEKWLVLISIDSYIA